MSTAPEPAESTTPAAPAAKVGLVPILMAVVLSTVVALAAVGGVGYYLIKSGKLSPVAAAGAPAAAAEKAKATAAAEQEPEELPASHVLALDPMVVNLSDAGGRSYLRASISLRIAEELPKKGEKKKEEGKPDKPDPGVSAALRDTTLAVLGEQTSDVLLASGGLDALKKKLRQTYALDNRETHVLDVYVTDFLVQRG